MRILTVPACLVLMAAPLHSQATPSARHWGLAPAVFPPGARIAVESGDPGKAGPFTVELAFPAGYKIPPHLHPTTEPATAKKGTLLVGRDDRLHAARTNALRPGHSGSSPAHAHHFAPPTG